MYRLRARLAEAALVGVVVALLVEGCQSPPSRVTYNSIDAAITAVQTAARTIIVLHDAGKVSDRTRDQAKLVYEQFQAVAASAINLAQASGNLSQQQQGALVQAAADTAVKALNDLAVKGVQ